MFPNPILLAIKYYPKLNSGKDYCKNINLEE